MNSNIDKATILTPSKPISSLSQTISTTPTEVAKPFYFTWTFWIIIIIILAYLGYNVFNYFAKGTQYVSNVLGPLMKIIFGLVGQTATQTASSAASGSEYISGKIKDESGNIVKNLNQPNNLKADLDKSPKQTNNDTDDEDTNDNDDVEYEEDSSDSTTQRSKIAGKSGWCYIGEDRGVKKCIQVGKYDLCDSGIVTNEKC